ncbi:hypothetical protein CR513_04554, partial [Mucuna pruriens]
MRLKYCVLSVENFVKYTCKVKPVTNIAKAIEPVSRRLKFSLFLKANMIAPACSAALPTIGSKIMLRKLTDKPHESDASC